MVPQRTPNIETSTAALTSSGETTSASKTHSGADAAPKALDRQVGVPATFPRQLWKGHSPPGPSGIRPSRPGSWLTPSCTTHR
jgi:hypothetical protein